MARRFGVEILHCGLPDEYVTHGTRRSRLALATMSVESALLGLHGPRPMALFLYERFGKGGSVVLF